MSRLARVFSATVVTLFAFVCAGSAQNEFQPITVTDADRYFVGQAQNTYYHILPTNDPERRIAASHFNALHTASTRPVALVAPDHAPFRFPGDLQFQGGATLTSTAFHSAFVNTTSTCPPNSCWGDPIGFLNDLFRSNFIHVMDQYTSAHADGRYTVGINFAVTYPVTSGVPLTDQDMRAIASTVESAVGSGYGHMVHVFLAPGQDVCINPYICFSPDNPSTFYFCAYHGSFDSNNQHIIYSVEPWNDVPGCQMESGTPNGQLADTTNYGVGHETIEAITDPDPGSGWLNRLSLSLFNAENADECVFFAPGQTGSNFYWYFDPSIVRLNGKLYAVNPGYSNSAHACATRPGTRP
jgi:hypothetical protein